MLFKGYNFHFLNGFPQFQSSGEINTADRLGGVLDKNLYLVLSKQIPSDVLVNMYNKRTPPKTTLNPRVLIGAVIIKRVLNLDDRETIAQITENMYLQYFLR